MRGSPLVKSRNSLIPPAPSTESSPRGLSQEPPPHPPSSSDTRPGGSRETTLVDKRENVQGEDNESRRGGGGRGGCDDKGGGGDGGSPVDNPVDPQLIVELEETEEDIVSTLQVGLGSTELYTRME